MRDHSYVCVYTWTWVGHIDSESAQHFRLGKTRNVFLVLLTGLKLGSWNVKFDAPPMEPPLKQLVT